MSAWRAAPGADPRESPADVDPIWAGVHQAWGIVGIGDTAGVVQWLSPSVEEVLGYRPDELLGTCALELMHPDDRDGVGDAYQSLTAPGESSATLTARALHHDGTWRHREVCFTNQPAQLAVAGVVVNARAVDVTNRVDAEASQRVSESRFRALVQNSHDLISIYDNEGRFVFASPSHERTLGYDPAELIGTPAVELLDPDELEEVARCFADQLLVTGIPAPIEHRIRHRDGSWRWIESVAMLLTHDPAIDGVLVNARDITHRRGAELIAAEQSRILEAIARGAPLPTSLGAIARLVDTLIPDGRAALTTVEPEGLVLHVAAAPNVPAACVAALEGFAVPADRDGISDAVARTDIWPAGPGQAATTLVEHGFRSWWGKPIVDAAGGSRKHLGEVIVLRPDEAEQETTDQRLLDTAGSLIAIAVERARSQTRLSHQALHDTLTGLPNREQALERLRRIDRHGRQGGPDVAVLFLDLDRFKVLNDSVGHDAGDRLLVSMGQRLHAALRPGDLIARFG